MIVDILYFIPSEVLNGNGKILTRDLVLDSEAPAAVLRVGVEGHLDLLAEGVELVLRGNVRAARVHSLMEQRLN